MTRHLNGNLRFVVGAVFFLLIGVGFVVYLAIRGADAADPPSRSEAGALAAFSAVAQLIASYMWSQVGRAHPSHARSAVRRLRRAQARSVQFSEAALQAYESGTSNERRLTLGQLTSGLDSLADDLLDAEEDWHEFHGKALKSLDNDGSS